jgi:hypothetical protein
MDYELRWLMYRRRWSNREKRVLLVLLTRSSILSKRRIGNAARTSDTTVSMVLMLLEGQGLAGHSPLDHYFLTCTGRNACLQILGLA